MSLEQFIVSSSCMGALEMKGDESAFLCFELAAQWGQAVMGTDGKCSDKGVTRVCGRMVGANSGR